MLPVAIVGAALRFPGAADPASFHELTIAGRRMFRELAAAVPRQSRAGGREPLLPLAFPPFRAALVDHEHVQLLEGHGAATAAEDLAELNALLDLLGPGARCALGSVSAIIGDTRGAAGVAALLKTALAMTADIIPPATVSPGAGLPAPRRGSGAHAARPPRLTEEAAGVEPTVRSG